MLINLNVRRLLFLGKLISMDTHARTYAWEILYFISFVYFFACITFDVE